MRDRWVLYVDPISRGIATACARKRRVKIGEWIAEAIRCAAVQESIDAAKKQCELFDGYEIELRLAREAREALECGSCNHTPCACDQQ
jgi:hypothetical protein